MSDPKPTDQERFWRQVRSVVGLLVVIVLIIVAGGFFIRAAKTMEANYRRCAALCYPYQPITPLLGGCYYKVDDSNMVCPPPRRKP